MTKYREILRLKSLGSAKEALHRVPVFPETLSVKSLSVQMS